MVITGAVVMPCCFGRSAVIARHSFATGNECIVSLQQPSSTAACCSYMLQNIKTCATPCVPNAHTMIQCPWYSQATPTLIPYSQMLEEPAGKVLHFSQSQPCNSLPKYFLPSTYHQGTDRPHSHSRHFAKTCTNCMHHSSAAVQLLAPTRSYWDVAPTVVLDAR
jgi:hypothetical protein